jgi:glycosyltransferase involved in cell wall biosynthesis
MAQAPQVASVNARGERKLEMRIGLLTSDFLPNIGGVAAHVYGLAHGLVALGHRVLVIHTVQDNLEPYDNGIAGLSVHRVLFRPHSLLPVRLLRLRDVVSQVESLLCKHKVQILHWHTIRPEGLIARLLHQPGVLKVFTNHTSGYLEMIESSLGRYKARFHLGHAQGVIAPSQELAEASRWLGISRSRIFFIPNGVDVERFLPRPPDPALRDRLGIGPDARIVLCPRRLVPKNGVRYLAEAIPPIVQESNQARFLIVGDGEAEEKDRIQRSLTQAGVSSCVTFTGAIPNASMPAFYNLADVVVLPSLVEATSIAGLEAMASGCPLVGTTVGGIPTLIEDGRTGYLIPPADARSLAKAVLSVLGDRGLRMRMGQEARKRAERKFSWHHIARQTVEVYVALGVMGEQ